MEWQPKLCWRLGKRPGLCLVGQNSALMSSHLFQRTKLAGVSTSCAMCLRLRSQTASPLIRALAPPTTLRPVRQLRAPTGTQVSLPPQSCSALPPLPQPVVVQGHNCRVLSEEELQVRQDREKAHSVCAVHQGTSNFEHHTVTVITVDTETEVAQVVKVCSLPMTPQTTP